MADAAPRLGAAHGRRVPSLRQAALRPRLERGGGGRAGGLLRPRLRDALRRVLAAAVRRLAAAGGSAVALHAGHRHRRHLHRPRRARRRDRRASWSASVPSTPGRPGAGGLRPLRGRRGRAVGASPRSRSARRSRTNALLERRGARVAPAHDRGLRGRPVRSSASTRRTSTTSTGRSPSRSSRRADCIGVRERIGADGTVRRRRSTDAELERVVGRRRAPLAERAATSRSPSACSSRTSNPAHERRLAALLDGRASRTSRCRSRTGSRRSGASTSAARRPSSTRTSRPSCVASPSARARACADAASSWPALDHEVERRPDARRPRRRRAAVQTVLSGLAGGIVAGRTSALAAGARDVVTLDMGGTSADVGARARRRSSGSSPEFELEFGLPIAHAGVDSDHDRRRRRLDRVGRRRRPAARRAAKRGRRARARPATGSAGPRRPSPTPTSCSAGSTRARSSAAAAARRRGARATALAALAGESGSTPTAAADAVVEVANEGMAGTIRRVAVERGVDPRDFELVAFGGAGPLHAAEIAASLGMAGVHRAAAPGPRVGVRDAARRPPRRPPLHALRALRRGRRRGARRAARVDGARRAHGARRGGLRRRAGRRAVAEHALRRPEPRARGAARAAGRSTSAPLADCARRVPRAAPRRLRLQLAAARRSS